MRRTLLYSARLCTLIALLLAALGVPAAHALPIRAGQTSLTIGVLRLPTTLDPLLDPQPSTADVTDSIFDSLLVADTHNALAPDLATDYTIGNGGRLYQFHLNARARWQDGIQVTADDVLFTAQLLRDRRFPAATRFGFGNITSIRADGPLTVTVTLAAPYAPFLRAFATTPLLPAHVLAPIPVGSIAGYAAFNRRPIGNGPYAVTEYQDGDHITLTANKAYFQGAPAIPQLIFRLEPSEPAALADLRSGAVQMLGPSVGITPAHLLAALQDGGLTAYASPGYGWTHIDLIESSFLRDHVVRQALTYATPRQRIVVSLFDGLATPADADQPPTSQYFQPQIAGSFGYDPSRVPGLLGSQGYTRKQGVWGKYGRTLSITLWTDQSCSECQPVARMVAASWAAVGIPTVVKAIPTRKLFGFHGPLYNPLRLYSQQLNAVLYTWATTPEPDDSFYWSSSMIVRPGHLSGGNFDGYSNPKVDRLTALALTTTDESSRIALYRSIQSYLVHDQPDIFLYWTSHLTLAVADLRGYRANPYHPGVTWNVAQWRLG